MIKRTIKYTDYNDQPQTMEAYFHLNKAELTELEVSQKGGLNQTLEAIVAEQDNEKIVALFKEIILMSYGKKSPDGQRFIKSKEMSEEFSQTEAYVELFMELATNEKAAAAFVNGVIPKDLRQEVAKMAENNDQ